MISLNRAALAAGSVIAFHVVSIVPATARDGVGVPPLSLSPLLSSSPALSSLGPASSSLWVTRLKSVKAKPELPRPRKPETYQTVHQIALNSGNFELSLAEALTTQPAFALAASQTVRRMRQTETAAQTDRSRPAVVSGVERGVWKDTRNDSGSLPQSLWQLASKATRQWADIDGLSAAVVQNIRFEGEIVRAASQHGLGVAWAQADTYTDIASWSNMLNGYVDFDIGTKVTPYVGAGLGTITYNLGGTGPGSRDIDSENYFNDSDVGYQGMAGLSYDLANNWSLSAEYRYAGALDYGRSYRTADDWDDTSHSARINFTKSFDLIR